MGRARTQRPVKSQQIPLASWSPPEGGTRVSQTARFALESDGKVRAAEIHGRPAKWVHCEAADKGEVSDDTIYWANPGTPLKAVMLAIHSSHTAPVAVCDDSEACIGAIGVRDVLQAILRR